MSETPEPNGYELQRAIDGLRKDMRDGLTDIKLILAGLVSRDLFDAENRRRDEQIAGLSARVDAQSGTAWRVWVNVVLPIGCLAGTVAINIIGR